ncbi:MAG: hypothetical protein D6766_14200 [Verrucomicrobia bacterium]|nr:MAG: hypothetical protein D6766_14200 [Verrucomicrobiota bacterium]
MVVGSRQDRIYRLTPRRNDAVNSAWMCDYGRLNYRWVHREDRLTRPLSRRTGATDWGAVLDEVAAVLRSAPKRSAAIVASARLSNEELWLVKRLAAWLEARTDCVPRTGEPDHLLLHEDRNPNSNGARVLGVCFTEVGINLPYLAGDVEAGRIRTLIVVGEDLTRPELELPEGWLDRLENLIVGDLFPTPTVERAHYVLAGCGHFEKTGTFINAHGRVQRFRRAVRPPGEARPEAEWLAALLGRLTGRRPSHGARELFGELAAATPALRGLSWERLGDQGVTVEL